MIFRLLTSHEYADLRRELFDAFSSISSPIIIRQQYNDYLNIIKKYINKNLLNNKKIQKNIYIYVNTENFEINESTYNFIIEKYNHQNKLNTILKIILDMFVELYNILHYINFSYSKSHDILGLLTQDGFICDYRYKTCIIMRFYIPHLYYELIGLCKIFNEKVFLKKIMIIYKNQPQYKDLMHNYTIDEYYLKCIFINYENYKKIINDYNTPLCYYTRFKAKYNQYLRLSNYTKKYDILAKYLLLNLYL